MPFTLFNSLNLETMEISWPLWDMEVTLCNNTPWLVLRHVPPVYVHPNGLRHLLDEVLRLESMMLDEGVAGWYTEVDEVNLRMRRALELLGASQYIPESRIAGSTYYFKCAGVGLKNRRVREYVQQWRAYCRDDIHNGN